MSLATRWLAVGSIFLGASLSWAQSGAGAGAERWTGSEEQKLWGLSTIWAEARYGFPSFAETPDLDWDRCYRDFIPRVRETQDVEEYYRVLMEFAGLLHDGHTCVLPPWGYLKPEFDNPPLEVQVVGGRFVVAECADSSELVENGVSPGLVIREIDGVEVGSYLEDSINRYYPRGSKHANEAVNVLYLLRGPRGSAVALGVEDGSGARRTVSLTRNATGADGKPFLPRALRGMAGGPVIEILGLPDDVPCARIAGFDQPSMVAEFLSLVDDLVEFGLAGLVIDLRYCLGGRSDIAEQMIGALIDEPVSTPLRRYPLHVPARRNWGMPPEWSTDHGLIPPRDGPRFLGPVVLLTGGTTSSTAEDFAISLRDGGRALLVGERTAGSAGNPSSHPLPGGGEFQMATFRAYLPEGGEYVGIGVKPDVEIVPTRKSIEEGVDVVLEKGLEVLRSWDSYSK